MIVSTQSGTSTGLESTLLQRRNPDGDRLHPRDETIHKSNAQGANPYFEQLFRSSPCASVVLDEGGRICECNEQFRTMLSANSAAVTKLPLSAFVERNSLAEFLRHLRECRITGKVATTAVSLRGSGGAVIAARLFSQLIRIDHSFRYRIIIIDDTERQHVLEEVRRDRQANQDFIDSIEAIVWEMDAESGRTTFISRKAERLLGFKREDWADAGEFRAQHLHVEDRERVLNELNLAISHRQGFVTEYRMITPDRRIVWLCDTITFREVAGRLKVCGVAVDISERKAAERKVSLAAAELERRVEERTVELRWTVSELESFSYTLSHDMRAPLRSIQGFAELILKSAAGGASPETAGYLGRIMLNARRLDALVQDVLKYSGLAKTPIDISPIDLDLLVRSIVEESLPLHTAAVKVQIAGKLLPVLGHEGFLAQSVSNLLSNAVKFVEPGVTPEIDIWTDRVDGLVRLWIGDNGIGITPGDQLRIFKPFERCHRHRKFEGTGIGLAIVERAASRMNGSVGVESLPGKGSKFWIQLKSP
jgi:PAS domain S-box-containing protein